VIKYIALSILLLTSSFYYLLIYDHINNHQLNVTQEISTLDSVNGEIPVPTDDDGKQKVHPIILVIYPIIILGITLMINLFIKCMKRFGLLTPIFYQSNYVVLPL
jgi:hypothetical protein